MKEVLQDKISKYKTNSEKYNYLREYLQLLILKIIEEKGYFQNIAFVGGTAVRILYDLPRFSEDLDFSSIKKLNFKDFLTNIKKELELYGFEIEITFKETKTVKNSFIKFKNILQELNITNQIDQKLSIKIEIDSNPPKGYELESTIINKEFLIQIRHYTKSSLFSGKLHAVLCRKFTKGRDYYDLLWFITKKTQPNYAQLANAYFQTENKKLNFTFPILKTKLLERLTSANFSIISKEIQKFIINPQELKYYQKDIYINQIKNWD